MIRFRLVRCRWCPTKRIVCYSIVVVVCSYQSPTSGYVSYDVGMVVSRKTKIGRWTVRLQIVR